MHVTRCRLSEAAKSASSATITATVGQENLLLQTYAISVPPPHNRTPDLVPGTRDVTATNIIRQLHPSLLKDHLPLSVTGDGNCFYRALSRGLYGHERYHALLRLLTALEIACFPCYYDTTRPDYLDIVMDKRISVPPYQDTLTSACTLGKETELVHMYAASAVIRMPIKSVHLVNNEHVQAWNRTVRGHDVSEDTHCKIQVLWSARAMPSDVTSFNPTHFVLLHRTAAPDQTTEVSDCDASGVEDMDAASRTDNTATAVAEDSFAAREDSFDASVHSVDLTSAGVEDMDVAAGK